MTGEMCYIHPITGEDADGNVWAVHAAIAQDLGGTVQPFDQYLGPYVLIGKDVRIGQGPYALAPRGLGVIRLWVCESTIYREDTDTQAPYLPYDEVSAVLAARSLMAETPITTH